MKQLSIISTFFTLSSSLIVTLALGSCGQGQDQRQQQRQADPSDTTIQVIGGVGQASFSYDLENPTVYTLPKDLKEISGIRFHKGDTAHIYAEQDEKGRLYWLSPGDKEVEEYDFGKDGDYEDLAFVRGQAVFLRSDGTLFSFDFKTSGKTSAIPVTGKLQEWKDLLPQGEYEGLYADTAKNELFVLCKDCQNEDHTQTVTIYRLDHEGSGWVKGPSYQVDVTKISALDRDYAGSGKKKHKHKSKGINFKPSALCQNPVTHEWYILSSVNKMLVVTGTDWVVRAVHPLDADIYPQPEGMCIDKDNNLYISNEAGGHSRGTLLKFPYKEN